MRFQCQFMMHAWSTRINVKNCCTMISTHPRLRSVIVASRGRYLSGRQVRLLDLTDRTQAVQHARHCLYAQRHRRVPDGTVWNTRPLRHQVEHIVTVLYAFRTVNNNTPHTTYCLHYCQVSFAFECTVKKHATWVLVITFPTIADQFSESNCVGLSSR